MQGAVVLAYMENYVYVETCVCKHVCTYMSVHMHVHVYMYTRG